MAHQGSSSAPSPVSSPAPPPDDSTNASGRPLRGERIFTITLLGLFGIAFGLGLFTFSFAKGFSYLSNDPAACVNCHIMREQFDGWNHSSHKAVATCNDCHTPHRFPDKWVIKAVNGWNHSVAFTTGNFPEPIMIRGFNANIAQENCVECHATTVAEMHLYVSPQELHCVSCHGNVGHDSAAPNTHFQSQFMTPLHLDLPTADELIIEKLRADELPTPTAAELTAEEPETEQAEAEE